MWFVLNNRTASHIDITSGYVYQGSTVKIYTDNSTTLTGRIIQPSSSYKITGYIKNPSGTTVASFNNVTSYSVNLDVSDYEYVTIYATPGYKIDLTWWTEQITLIIVLYNRTQTFGQCSYVGNDVNDTPTKDTLYSYHANHGINGTVDGRNIHYSNYTGTVTGGYIYNGCEYVKAGSTINIPYANAQFIFKSVLE